ncbi:MAG: twin-arginine translocase subunit TatC [Intrasporangiaceae bacterium]|nr:twin-arginine translocase subunit TatC [Intrasporangiaceae bacterium]
MTLAEHFKEFRRRLLVSAAAVGVIAIAVGTKYFWPLYYKLTEPWYAYKDANPDSLISLNFGEATSALSQRISLSIWAGIILSSPVWLYQIWAFIVPGLTKKEKRWSLAFIAAMVPLFLTGVFVAFTILPMALQILYGFTPPGSSNIQDNAKYFAFVTRLMLVFGLGFLLPVFMVAFNLIGVLPARFVFQHWRVAILLIMVFAAVATPTGDASTMLMLGVPLTGLYFLAGLIMKVIEKRRARNQPAWTRDLADDQASSL